MASVFYNHPKYYDVAFGWDPGPEADFLEICFQRYGPDQVESVLDVACGAGRFSLEFARRGLIVAGLDISPDMIDYLGKKVAIEALPVEVFVRDMKEFQLPRKDFGAAICATDSFTYLLDVPSILSHLRSVARHLVDRGVYIVDFGTVVDPAKPFGAPETWEAARDDVRVVFTGNEWEEFNPVLQQVTEVLRMQVTEHGQGQVIEQRSRKRVLYPQEFLALVEASNVFELAAWFQGFDLERPFDTPPFHRRLVAVLRRKGAMQEIKPESRPQEEKPAKRERAPRKRKAKAPAAESQPPAPLRLPSTGEEEPIEEYWARGKEEPWRPPARDKKQDPPAAAEPAAAKPKKRRRRRKKKSGESGNND